MARSGAREPRTVRARPAPTQHLGDRLPAQPSAFRRVCHDHGLSIALVALFMATMAGQALSGWRVYNDERQQHAADPISFAQYLTTGHFGEATFENWESEFLQMAFYVLLTIFLYQRGSSESKRPDVIAIVDLDPRDSPQKDTAPWPVRRGGLMLKLYENSLTIAFGVLFLASFAFHAMSGVAEYNREQLAHGQPSVSVSEYVRGAQFWFESFQNWQSEFLSLAAMVVFSIFLRQRGSPESKPVDAPTWETGN